MLKYELIPVTPFQQNCSLVWDDETNEGVLIDPGGDIKKIRARIELHRVLPKAVWLTHGHIDHVGAAKEVALEYAIPIWGPHRADQFWFDILETQAKMFGFQHQQSFLPDRWLSHGETLMLGGSTVSVKHCPGHTPGHIVFYIADIKRVFVGDVLFVGSIGRTDFPQGNQEQLINSIRQQLMTLSEQTGFIPGHGPEGTIGTEKMYNPYLT